MINSVHHFEILTKNHSKLLNYFINGLNFKLIATNNTNKSRQHVVKSNNIHFILTAINSNDQKVSEETHDHHKSHFQTLFYLNKNLFDKVSSKQDSVFNVALQVKSIDRILDNCHKNDVLVVKPKESVEDRYGHVNYAVVNSCIDGVVHTLIERSKYNGQFLPNFNLIDARSTQSTYDDKYSATHFDHLTYATYKNTTESIIDWYGKVFNMKKFQISNNEKDGAFIVKTGNSGMQLKALNYWFCAETGIYLNNEDKNVNDFKFVIAEPLDNNEENQISIFLNENKGPGVQHIGLYTPNILKSVELSKKHNKDVKFYVPPDSYYEESEKISDFKKIGQNSNSFKDNHILIDVEPDDDNKNSQLKKSGDAMKYLLQVFTRPLFDKNTFFLEFIQRCNGAFGFGAGNIRALWNAVQFTLVNEIKKTKN